MKKNSFTSVKDLPIMLSVSQVAAVLNISRASAYELAHCKNFPAMLVGCRIVVSKDKLLAWIEARVAMNELCS
ncbi:helix-turn-helix domain-containing protein [Flintibacter muris]|uniref:helix-turn-helix domain-containing protein n=1 Tax=Flintibacter muris TaxID=2941327 RepID=UPI00203E444B|nr:helix-turn-helix domain-containing protein [Flintibacter muris]